MADNQIITGIKACVFDAYGTLFDVHSAVGVHRAALGDMADAVSVTWRDKQLQYTWLRSLMGAHEEFWTVTGDALDYALDAHGVDDAPLREALMQAYLELKPYAEVGDALRGLKERGFKRRSTMPACRRCSMPCSVSRRSAFTSPIAGSINSPAIASPSRRTKSPSCHRTPGTSAAPPTSASKWCGSIASHNPPTASPASPRG